MTTANSYKAQLELNYQQSLNELSENLDSIETTTKSIYSNSRQMLMDINKDLYAECSQAKDALSRLPIEQMNLGSTYKFINQITIGDHISQTKRLKPNTFFEEHQNPIKPNHALNESCQQYGKNSK